MEAIKYVADNAEIINLYCKENGFVEGIKALRSMFDENGNQKKYVPDVFKGSPASEYSNLSLADAKYLIDLASR